MVGGLIVVGVSSGSDVFRMRLIMSHGSMGWLVGWLWPDGWCVCKKRF